MTTNQILEINKSKFRKKYFGKDLAIVIKKSKLKQKLFHEHHCSEGHQGIENWSVNSHRSG